MDRAELQNLADGLKESLLDGVQKLTGAVVENTDVNQVLLDSLAMNMAVAISTRNERLLETTKAQSELLGQIIFHDIQKAGTNVLAGLVSSGVGFLNIALRSLAQTGAAALTDALGGDTPSPPHSGSRKYRGDKRKSNL